MWGWIQRNYVWLLCVALLFLFDWGLSWLVTCVGGEQQQAEQCAKEGHGLTHTYTVSALAWVFRLIKDEYNFVTAASAIVVAIFTVTLWRATDKLRDIGEQQKTIAAQAADIAERQVLITGRQTDIQEKQHAIGRLQFLATHRPKIRTKHVTLLNNLFEEEGGPFAANVTLINEGAGDAFLHEFGIKFLIEEKEELLPPISVVEFRKKDLGKFQLEIGKSTTLENEKDGTLIAVNQGYAIGRGDLRLYCAGYVHYSDGIGQVRTTAFCRVLEFAPNAKSWVNTGRFRVFEDPDYEYRS
jgi:hypothetical protein